MHGIVRPEIIGNCLKKMPPSDCMAKDITKHADRRDVNTNVSANSNNADRDDQDHFRRVAKKKRQAPE